MDDKSGKRSVLFVCLGNICRSPMAEAVFQNLLESLNLNNEWHVDSAAVSDYHIGRHPDERTMSVLASHGITTYVHKARQVTGSDFLNFDYIMGMDESNVAELKSMCSLAVNGEANCKIELLGKYDPQGNIIVPDPYFENDMIAFEEVYDQCLRCCKNFLSQFDKAQTTHSDV